MDKCSSDAEFDSYWEYEAKNKNRNRIRVGRQYQATIPPLLKPGEKDDRKCEDLETLKWKPEQLTDPDIQEYLSMARAITSFSKAIEKCRDPDHTPDSSFQTAIKGLTEFVTSHHPCHQDAGCKVPVSFSPGESSSSKPSTISDWTAPEAHLFAQAVEACGKNFCAIKKEYLPWKPVRSLIEYYYYYGKAEKPESPINPKVPSESSCKEEEEEPVASCSHNLNEVSYHDTKEEPVEVDVKKEKEEEKEVKEEAVLQATTVENITSESCKSELDQVTEKAKDVSQTAQSTVGSLKFFLGGRLVLKLSAQQYSGSGARCQWVQSNDTPRHPYQVKKLKHKKKVLPEAQEQQNLSESPSHKKKLEDSSSTVSEESSPVTKKARLRLFNADVEFSPLCSASWTPPVADGQDSVELDDASSKTSEGCVSPVVLGLHTLKSEVRTEAPVDSKPKLADANDVQDRKHSWIKAESLAVPCTSHSEPTYAEDTQNFGFISENVSPKSHGDDSSYNHEVLNHKSALQHMRSAAFLPRTAHYNSPGTKFVSKRISPSTDLTDKVKSSPGFHSPASFSCSTSSENSAKEFVLDLSSRTDHCESRDTNASHQTYCHISPTRCNEICSSSEGSPHTSCSSAENTVLCCKSSNCAVYNKDRQVPAAESKDSEAKNCHRLLNANQFSDANGANECPNNFCGSQDGTRMNCDQCSCCFDPSISCTSTKCYKNYSSKEPVCNKEGHTAKSPNPSITCIQPTNEEPYSQKLMPWFGAPASSLLHLYSPCYPYYVTYGVNASSTISDSSTDAEIPLDLSSNASSKGDKTLRENVPDGQAEVSQNTSDTLDRGMLYQLLKNKVTK